MKRTNTYKIQATEARHGVTDTFTVEVWSLPTDWVDEMENYTNKHTYELRVRNKWTVTDYDPSVMGALRSAMMADGYTDIRYTK